MSPISVVVPVYNKIDNLKPVCKAVEAAFVAHPSYHYGLLLVDEDSCAIFMTLLAWPGFGAVMCDSESHATRSALSLLRAQASP